MPLETASAIAMLSITLMYEICETVHHFLGGNWKALKDYDDELVDTELQDRGNL